MTDVEFIEPPPPGRTNYDWQAIAERLRSRPEKWALVFENDKTSLVVSIRGGHIAALRPDYGFECTTRNNRKLDDGRRFCDLFMRYMPAQDTSVKRRRKGGK